MATFAASSGYPGWRTYGLKTSPYSSHITLMSLFPAQGGRATVLDVGCGDGHVAAMLASRGFRVTGVERAGGHGPHFPPDVELIEADLEGGLPPLDGRFDYVLCADILEHLRHPDHLLLQIREVMKPGARLIASLPNSGHLYFRLNVLLGRFPLEERGLFDQTHMRFYMLNGWKDLLARSGFRIETMKVTGVPVSLLFPARAAAPLVRFAERLSYDLARLWKTLFAYQFVVTAVAANDTTQVR